MNTPQQMHELPIMKRAFRTTSAHDGLYEMTFRFESIDEMHQADIEWHAFRDWPAPPSQEEEAYSADREGGRSIETMTPDDEDWSEWIHPLPGFRIQCCDCGLVHEMEAAIGQTATEDVPRNDGETKNRVVLFRMRRVS